MKNNPDEQVKQGKAQPEKPTKKRRVRRVEGQTAKQPKEPIKEQPEKQGKEQPEKPTKEQAILLAAEQEFLSKGYDGARTTSIADAAGVTHAMLHYYFRTKEQLFERILNEKMALMASSMVAVMGNPSLPLVERIGQGIGQHFDFLMANPELPRFIINEVVTHPDRLRIMQENIVRIAGVLFAQLQQEIDAAAERGEVERMDVRMLIMDMLSLNILPFLIYPVVENVFSDMTADREAFFEARKAEAIETVMRRIKKNSHGIFKVF